MADIDKKDVPLPNPKGLSVEDQIDQVVEDTGFDLEVSPGRSLVKIAEEIVSNAEKRNPVPNYIAKEKLVENSPESSILLLKAYEVFTERVLKSGKTYEDADDGRKLDIDNKQIDWKSMGGNPDCLGFKIDVYKSRDEDKEYTVIVGTIGAKDPTSPDALVLRKKGEEVTMSILSSADTRHPEQVARLEQQQMANENTCISIISFAVAATLSHTNHST